MHCYLRSHFISVFNIPLAYAMATSVHAFQPFHWLLYIFFFIANTDGQLDRDAVNMLKLSVYVCARGRVWWFFVFPWYRLWWWHVMVFVMTIEMSASDISKIFIGFASANERARGREKEKANRKKSPSQEKKIKNIATETVYTATWIQWFEWFLSACRAVSLHRSFSQLKLQFSFSHLIFCFSFAIHSNGNSALVVCVSVYIFMGSFFSSSSSSARNEYDAKYMAFTIAFA